MALATERPAALGLAASDRWYARTQTFGPCATLPPVSAGSRPVRTRRTRGVRHVKPATVLVTCGTRHTVVPGYTPPPLESSTTLPLVKSCSYSPKAIRRRRLPHIHYTALVAFPIRVRNGRFKLRRLRFRSSPTYSLAYVHSGSRSTVCLRRFVPLSPAEAWTDAVAGSIIVPGASSSSSSSSLASPSSFTLISAATRGSKSTD